MDYTKYSADELARMIENSKIVIKKQTQNGNFEAALKTSERLESIREELANR